MPTKCIWNTLGHFGWYSWNGDDPTDDSLCAFCCWSPCLNSGAPWTLMINMAFGRKICRCLQFLLMLWPIFLIYVPEKGQQTPYRKKNIFAHIPLAKHSEFKSWLPFIRAKSRFAPLRDGEMGTTFIFLHLRIFQLHTEASKKTQSTKCVLAADSTLIPSRWFWQFWCFKLKFD